MSKHELVGNHSFFLWKIKVSKPHIFINDGCTAEGEEEWTEQDKVRLHQLKIHLDILMER